MARRGFTIVFTLLGFALVISMAGVSALYLLVGREPAVPANADADAADRRRSRRGRAGRRRRLRQRRRTHADRPLDRRQPAQGQGRRARQRRAPQADRVHDAVLGQDSGNPRRGPRFQEVGQADLRVPRVRRRSRLLPGDRGRQGVPDAVEPAGSRPASPPTSCSCAARSTRSASTRTCTTSATTRRRRTRSPRRHTPRRTARWTSRSTAISTSRSSAASPTAARRPRPTCGALIDDGPFLPEDALRAGLIDDVAYEDQVTEKLRRRRRRARRATSTATTTRASAPRSLGLNRGSAHRRHLRRRRDRQRAKRLRSAERRGRRLRHADRVHPAARGATARFARSCCASTAPADRRRRPTPSGAS